MFVQFGIVVQENVILFLYSVFQFSNDINFYRKFYNMLAFSGKPLDLLPERFYILLSDGRVSD